jgi:ABC-2 type transport system ATP-binding protein
VVLNHGQLVTTGPLDMLQQAGTSVRTESAHQLTELLNAAGATTRIGTEGELVVRGIGIAEIGDRACAAGIALHELSPQAGSLEELFLGWTSTDSTPVSDTDITVTTEPERQAASL